VGEMVESWGPTTPGDCGMGLFMASRFKLEREVISGDPGLGWKLEGRGQQGLGMEGGSAWKGSR